MCEQFKFDITDEVLNSLAIIMRNRVANTVSDECSMEIFDEAEINDADDLLWAIGMTMFNSAIVDAVTEQMARVEESAEERGTQGIGTDRDG